MIYTSIVRGLTKVAESQKAPCDAKAPAPFLDLWWTSLEVMELISTSWQATTLPQCCFGLTNTVLSIGNTDQQQDPGNIQWQPGSRLLGGSSPHLGNMVSTWSNTLVQASRTVSTVCLPANVRLFTVVLAVTSDDRASFGLAWTIRRPRFNAGSFTKLGAPSEQFSKPKGRSLGNVCLQSTLAMSRANLLG